jgi:hypothetical protein
MKKSNLKCYGTINGLENKKRKEKMIVSSQIILLFMIFLKPMENMPLMTLGINFMPNLLYPKQILYPLI